MDRSCKEQDFKDFVNVNQDSCSNICIFADVMSKKRVGEKCEPT